MSKKTGLFSKFVIPVLFYWACANNT